jgi:hypothetical protein
MLAGMPGSLGAHEVGYAWWLTARFEATETAIESLPLQQLDPSWVAASLLRDALLPPEASVAGESLEEHGANFEVVGDLDGDGRAEKTVVGVYRTRTGEVGEFALVLSRGRAGRWNKRALFTVAGEAGFSALIRDGKHLRWASCMECDSYCTIIPARRKWSLQYHSCCG